MCAKNAVGNSNDARFMLTYIHVDVIVDVRTKTSDGERGGERVDGRCGLGDTSQAGG